MKTTEQLNLWVEGKSIHNDELNECCPDFSCCNKKVTTPKAVREIFRNAYLKGNRTVVDRMLMEFLSGALADEFPSKKVYIVGLDASRREAESDIEL